MQLPLARHRKPRASKPVAAQTSPGTGLCLLLLVTAGHPLLGLGVPQAWGWPPTAHRGPAVQIQLACVDQRLPALSVVDTPRPSPLLLPFPVGTLACQAPGTLGLMGHFPHFTCSSRCLLGHPQSCNPSSLVSEHSITENEKKPRAHEQPLPTPPLPPITTSPRLVWICLSWGHTTWPSACGVSLGPVLGRPAD